jgi:RNA polymerase Rpb2, domain 6
LQKPKLTFRKEHVESLDNEDLEDDKERVTFPTLAHLGAIDQLWGSRPWASISPTYHQRLNYMVDDKIRSRENGPVTMLTR